MPSINNKFKVGDRVVEREFITGRSRLGVGIITGIDTGYTDTVGHYNKYYVHWGSSKPVHYTSFYYLEYELELPDNYPDFQDKIKDRMKNE